MNMIKLVDDFGVEKIESVDDIIKLVTALMEKEISIQDNTRTMKNIGVITEEECEKICSACAYTINKLSKIYLLLPTKSENE